MKKLMIAAVIVCAAAMTQAASFTWKSSGNLTTDGSTIATGMSGNLALVYLGNDAAAVDWTAITSASVVQTGKPTFTSGMSGTTAKASVAFNFEMTDYGNGDIFGVVFQDGDKFYYLTDGSGNKLDGTYEISGLTKDNDPLSSFTFASGDFQANTSMPVNVPEPTSGLLLLLGVAGMALRRRRA